MLHRLWRRLWRRQDASGTQDPSHVLVRAAFEDVLTGLPTRHVAFERILEARRAGVRGFAAMADLDHFKQLNDSFGHTAGDEVLRVTAERLQQALPDGGWVARMGGEEFCIFLPGLTQAEAVAWLNAANARLSAPMDLISAKVSASFGVTSFVGQSPDNLISACDLAMYAAKARGRNQVVVFDDDTRAVATSRRELAATVAELQQRNQALLDEARTDALTGLRNRRALDEALATAEADQIAVAFLDIDHFGEFNHLHTDTAGDAALRAVAAAVQATIRQEDQAFRKGGEELVVLLHAADPGAALAVAQRLRQAVQALAIPHAGSPTAAVLTITVGVAHASAKRSVQQTLEAAAALAMAAKRNAQRNQVHAEPLPGAG